VDEAAAARIGHHLDLDVRPAPTGLGGTRVGRALASGAARRAAGAVAAGPDPPGPRRAGFPDRTAVSRVSGACVGRRVCASAAKWRFAGRPGVPGRDRESRLGGRCESRLGGRSGRPGLLAVV
jgi:hypothetical protein